MSEELILPKKPTKAQLKNPSPLLIFGQPKIGKTTCIANLKNNLVLNFEDKVQSADGMVMYIDSLKKLKEVAQAIKKAAMIADIFNKEEYFIICEQAAFLYSKVNM